MGTYLKYTLITIILISFLISAANIVIAYDNINIESCTIETDNAMNERTYAKIFVGEEHSNENVKIQIYYSYNKEKLNQGKKVGVTVDNSGCIEVYSAKPLKKYPNHAKINIYNSQGDKLLDSESVNLVDTSGKQNFVFSSNNGPMKIKKCLIKTDNAMNERTYAKIFVGEEHSNENVKIQIYYSYNKEKLNQGKKVGVTVDNSGCIEVYSAKPLKKYPNHAKINIYNSQGDKLLDSKSVKLAASKGTQTFYAPEKSSSSSSNSVKTSSSNKNNYNSKSSQTYIGNKNTGKFHYPGCRSVSQMKNSNKVYLSSRNDAISRGYSSCAICNP